MIPRHLATSILKYIKEYPLIALVGPRQSGKTTLAKALFPDYEYVSLESLDFRQRASTDPRGFLNDLGAFVILDEIQRVPELFSYLQERVDTDPRAGQYVLTGSSQFLLIEQITQSLAGRIATFKLYPLTYKEFCCHAPDLDPNLIFEKYDSQQPVVQQEKLYELLWKGLYPRIHDRNMDSRMWYENYLLTYVERDVRSLLNIRNLRTFEQFLVLIASQSAQLMNYSNLANALGISLPTVKEWISILETSGLIFILPPYFENFSKRIVKTPKIYFTDSGLLCHLLSIRNAEQLKTHPLLGAVFETFLISECFKRFHHAGERPPLYFWRDQSGHEIDLLIHHGNTAFPIEIKLAQTFHHDFSKNISHWLQLKSNQATRGMVIYCGTHPAETTSRIPAIPWHCL